MRYKNTERLGVNKTEEITLRELDWIFREQSIVDVGIDAILEEVIDGDPTGKLLAVQIKTGKSHFTIKEDALTYYVTHIHYNYWLSLNIPRILIAYLPETKEIYWQFLEQASFQRTKEGWKLTIPKKNVFGAKAKFHLSQKLAIRSNLELYSEINKFEHRLDSIEDLNSFTEYPQSISRLADIQDAFNIQLSNLNDELSVISTIQNINERVIENEKFARKQARIYFTYSRRYKKEIEIFSEFFAEGLHYFEQILHFIALNGFSINKDFTPSLKKQLLYLIEDIKITQDYKNIFENYQFTFSIQKEGVTALLSVYDMKIVEYSTAARLMEKLILNLEKV